MSKPKDFMSFIHSHKNSILFYFIHCIDPNVYEQSMEMFIAYETKLIIIVRERERKATNRRTREKKTLRIIKKNGGMSIGVVIHWPFMFTFCALLHHTLEHGKCLMVELSVYLYTLHTIRYAFFVKIKKKKKKKPKTNFLFELAS